MGLLCKILTHFPVISFHISSNNEITLHWFLIITIHRIAEDDETRRNRLNAQREYNTQIRYMYVLTTVLYHDRPGPPCYAQSAISCDQFANLNKSTLKCRETDVGVLP